MSQILHNEFDFTQPGGFPLTQDRLKFMQEATGEALRALIATAGDHVGPYILSGMHITEPAPGDIAVSDGWFIFNGKIVKFTGTTITPGADEAMVQITNLTSNLIFYASGSQPVQLSAVATLIASSLPPDDDLFPLSDAIEWPVAVGRNYHDDWITIEADLGLTLTYVNIKYRRDRITNTVHIRGTLNVGDPHGAGGDEPLSLGTIQYLPADMGFLEMINIPNYVHNGGVVPKTNDGIDYIRSIPIFINSGASIATSIIQPDLGTGEYSVFINHIFSLD